MLKIDTTKEFQLLEGVLVQFYKKSFYKGTCYEKYIPYMKDALKSSGGICASIFDNKLLRKVSDEDMYLDSLEYFSLRKLDKIISIHDRYDLIVVGEEIVNLLTAEELEAIMYHELGHIHLGHVARVVDSIDVGDVRENMRNSKPEVIADINNELEADSYAIQFCEPAVLLSALNKVFTTIDKEVIEATMFFHRPRVDNLIKLCK